MKTTKRDGLALVALTLMVVTSFYAWGRVPELLPVHWGIDGQPDRYGGRLEALGILPLSYLLLYGLAVFLQRVKSQPEENKKLTRSILHIVMLALAALHLALVANYLGAGLDVPRLASFTVGVILIGTGNLLPKAQPNRWVGVRTPWTLKSKESWYKSQRAGGWVLTLCGVAFLLAALFNGSGVVVLSLLGVTLLSVVGLFYYSYRVWRNGGQLDQTS